MLKNQVYRLFDYKIKEDLIYYTSSLGITKKSPTKKRELGILICEIDDWVKNIKSLSEILNHFLIDSFSLQIDINKKDLKLFLILKINGIGPFELNFRYRNLKNRCLGINGFNIKFLSHSTLETVFLSIIGDNNLNTKTKLKNYKIIRDKNRFFLQNEMYPSNSRSFFYLKEFDIELFLQDSEKPEVLAGILYTANIQGSLIFYSGNFGSYSLNSCYFVTKTKSIKNLEKVIQKNLKSWKIKSKNSFHPQNLGKILIRDSLDNKKLYKCKIPPILSTNFSTIKFDTNDKKVQITKSNKDQLISKKYNILKRQKYRGIINCQRIENLVKKMDPSLIKESNEKFILYDNTTILFLVNNLKENTLQVLIRKLSKDLEYCILFFNNIKKLNNFNSKLGINQNNFKKINFVYGINDLVKILSKIKTIVTNKPIIHNIQ